MSNEYRKRDVARALGMALREVRVKQGISQDVLSEICDVDRKMSTAFFQGDPAARDTRDIQQIVDESGEIANLEKP